jgi:hypothetical protein
MFTFYGTVLALALWIPAAASTDGVIAFAVLYGVPLGVFSAIIPALVAGMSDIKKIGYRVGTTFLINGIAGLIGNPIAGALIGVNGTTGADSFLGVKIFCGVATGISTSLFIITRVYLKGSKLGIKV